jgi:A/G-specific adenine glycosylase
VAADAATTWNVAVMELGALVCRARGPRCEECPLLEQCAWVGAGRPAHDGPVRRGQAWHGTDRQVRGAVLQLLRDAPRALTRAALATAGPDAGQLDRCLASLIEDGLVEPAGPGRYRLPA